MSLQVALMQEITSRLGLLEKSKLVLDSNQCQIRQIAAKEYFVAWQGSHGLAQVFDEEQNPLQTYAAIVQNRFYSALLEDGGLLQIAYHVRGDQVVNHRLCFFPCPITLTENDFVVGLGDAVVGLSLEEIGARWNHTCIVRFEFNQATMSEVHPAAHVTFCKACCRVPMVGPINAGAFINFVLTHFYPEQVSANPGLISHTTKVLQKTITSPQRNNLHFNLEAPLLATLLTTGA